MTLEAIGQVYGLTRERVRRVDTKTRFVLRNHIVNRPALLEDCEYLGLKAERDAQRQVPTERE